MLFYFIVAVHTCATKFLQYVQRMYVGGDMLICRGNRQFCLRNIWRHVDMCPRAWQFPENKNAWRFHGRTGFSNRPWLIRQTSPIRRAIYSYLNPALLGGFPQVSNAPHRPLLFPAVKTTTCHFPIVNLVSYSKTSNSITKCTVIDSRFNGLRIFHFLVIQLWFYMIKPDEENFYTVAHQCWRAISLQ